MKKIKPADFSDLRNKKEFQIAVVAGLLVIFGITVIELIAIITRDLFGLNEIYYKVIIAIAIVILMTWQLSELRKTEDNIEALNLDILKAKK